MFALEKIYGDGATVLVVSSAKSSSFCSNPVVVYVQIINLEFTNLKEL